MHGERALAHQACTPPTQTWRGPALPAAARYVDQGGGKRKGAFAMYCEPWHADIFDWLCVCWGVLLGG